MIQALFPDEIEGRRRKIKKDLAGKIDAMVDNKEVLGSLLNNKKVENYATQYILYDRRVCETYGIKYVSFGVRDMVAAFIYAEQELIFMQELER